MGKQRHLVERKSKHGCTAVSKVQDEYRENLHCRKTFNSLCTCQQAGNPEKHPRASTAACRCFLNCQCCVLQSCYNAFVNMNIFKNTKASIVNVQFSGWMTTTNHMLHCRKELRIYILVNGNPQLTLEIYVKHPRASAPACQC